VLATQEKAFGHSHRALIPVLADLDLVQAGLGDHLGAREQIERVRSARAASPLPDPLGQALDLVSLSDSYRHPGDMERAWPLAREALSTARKCLPTPGWSATWSTLPAPVRRPAKCLRPAPVCSTKERNKRINQRPRGL
jgi:hypothetical protein